MVRLEQFEDDLFLLSVNTSDGTFKFSGVFKQMDGLNLDDLMPAKNGLKLEVKLYGEE